MIQNRVWTTIPAAVLGWVLMAANAWSAEEVIDRVRPVTGFSAAGAASRASAAAGHIQQRNEAIAVAVGSPVKPATQPLTEARFSRDTLETLSQIAETLDYAAYGKALDVLEAKARELWAYRSDKLEPYLERLETVRRGLAVLKKDYSSMQSFIGDSNPFLEEIQGRDGFEPVERALDAKMYRVQARTLRAPTPKAFNDKALQILAKVEARLGENSVAVRGVLQELDRRRESEFGQYAITSLLKEFPKLEAAKAEAAETEILARAEALYAGDPERVEGLRKTLSALRQRTQG